MSNPAYADIFATTIENRSRRVQDNVTNNNAILKKLSMRGNIRPFSGGTKILEEISWNENSNAGWYSGYDILPVGISEVITAAEYNIKQAAVPVVMSGLEQLQNAGRERMIDLMEARLKVAESTMSNLISEGLYSDGSAATMKQIDGLEAAVPTDPTASPYGGIDGNTYPFWQNAVQAGALNPDTINGLWNDLWAQLVRGNDRPDLIMCDNNVWSTYTKSLQNLQRFATPDVGEFGFPTLKFMDADVCLDGGIYKQPNFPTGNERSGSPTNTAFFLNTNFIHYRPHSQRNMVPLSPNRRYATNQDAEVQILAWAGNLTCSGRMFQGRFNGS